MKHFKIEHYGNVAICNNREFNSLLEESIQYSFPELGFKKVGFIIYFNKEKGNLAKFLEYIYEGLVRHFSSDILGYEVADPEDLAKEIIEELKKEMVKELYQKRLEDKRRGN